MNDQIQEIEAIQEGWKKHVLNIKPSRNPEEEEFTRDYFYAGSWRPCNRRMVLEATHPNYFPEPDADAKARFIRGEQREIDLRQALERVGQLCMPSFTVEGQQERIFLRDRRDRKVISGKKDCAIRWESGARWSTEFKAWSVFLTDRIFTFLDLLNSPWTKAGAMQLLAYLYGKNEPYGLLVLDRPGLPRLIPVRLEQHYDLMERFLIDAEEGRDHIEAKTLPSFIDDPGECRRCPVFGAHCNPPMSQQGATIITDEEMLAKIELHDKLDPPRKEYKGIHDEIAEYLKRQTPKTHVGKNKKQIVAGNFLIESRWTKNTTIELPAAIKAEYQKSDPSGKFDFDIIRVTE